MQVVLARYRLILSAAKRNYCSFWQYKVYVDIRGGSLERGRQITVAKTSIFRAFGHYVFGNLGNEANIIIYYYLVPCRLSIDPKIYDLEWP